MKQFQGVVVALLLGACGGMQTNPDAGTQGGGTSGVGGGSSASSGSFSTFAATRATVAVAVAGFAAVRVDVAVVAVAACTLPALAAAGAEVCCGEGSVALPPQAARSARRSGVRIEEERTWRG